MDLKFIERCSNIVLVGFLVLIWLRVGCHLYEDFLETLVKTLVLYLDKKRARGRVKYKSIKFVLTGYWFWLWLGSYKAKLDPSDLILANLSKWMKRRRFRTLTFVPVLNFSIKSIGWIPARALESAGGWFQLDRLLRFPWRKNKIKPCFLFFLV